MTTREDRIDTLLNAAALLIDTAINQIDPSGTIGVGDTREIQDGCSTLRVARDLVEQARFFPEDAKVWIPNESGQAVATMTFSPRNAEEPLPFPSGPGVLTHKDGLFTFTPAIVRTAPSVEGALSELSLKGGVGGSSVPSAGDSVPYYLVGGPSGPGGSFVPYAGDSVPYPVGGVGGTFSVPPNVVESPRRRDLREKYRTHGTGDFPSRPNMHGGQGHYCNTCEGICFLELMRLGAKL